MILESVSSCFNIIFYFPVVFFDYVQLIIYIDLYIERDKVIHLIFLTNCSTYFNIIK